MAKYDIKDPAIHPLAKIVHRADLAEDMYGRPKVPGLMKSRAGFTNPPLQDWKNLRILSAIHKMSLGIALGLKDNHEILAKEFIVYADALYA